MLDNLAQKIFEQVNHLVQKHESLALLKQKVLEDIPKLEETILDFMEGVIVQKKVCCHKKTCSTCGGTKNAHGPYPHLQWRDDKGVMKTRYVSRKNLVHFTEQLQLSRKLARDRRLLVRIQDRQSKIVRTMDNVGYQLLGKGVNQDVA